MPSYKFSDIIDYSANNLTEMYSIEHGWYEKAVSIITSSTAFVNVLDKRAYLEAVTKAVDEKLEITSINQLVFLIQVIEESKNFKIDLMNKAGDSIKNITTVISNSIDDFDNAKSI